MPRVVTLTLNPAVDKSTSTAQLVAEDKLRCSRPALDPGGGGINVARAMRRLGVDATALWSCGGATGQTLAGLLDKEAVSHRPIRVEDATRENLTVQEESSGQQYRFTLPGPNLEAAEVDRWLEQVRGLDPPPDFLVASGSLPPGVSADFYARVARTAPAHCRVVIDTKGAALRSSLGDRTYLIKPNLRELGQLAGRPIDGDEEIVAAAREIVQRGDARVVVVSLGRAGAVMVAAEQAGHVRSPTVPIRSKVGAGDSMVGGIVASLARGEPLEQALRFGVAAGAAAVMTPGVELCRRDDTQRLFQQLAREVADQGQTAD